MRDNQEIEITYQSYWKNKSYTFYIEPYCVKVFKQRWYVVARIPYYDAVMIYALDRIQDLQTTNIRFEYRKILIHKTISTLVSVLSYIKSLKLKEYK